MNRLLRSISELVERRHEEAIGFLQELIRTPSPSGQEAAVASVAAEKMQAVGFNAVKLDGLNDVMATLRGDGGGRSLLLNGHLDHVPAGTMIDPYSGRLMDGAPLGVDGEVVYGRAASDMKGAVAAMVMAGAVLAELGVELRGDLKVAAVVQEETGGVGTLSTIQEDNFLGDVVVIGEATDMDVALGHRGSMKAVVVVHGKSCHASAPERGVNALYKASDLITRIRSDLVPRLPEHPKYGRTTLAVTKIGVKPDALNVVPEECEFHIDCRNTPDFPAEALKKALEEIIASMRKEDPDLDALVVPTPPLRSQNGFTGFYTDPEAHPVVGEARDAVAEVLGREPRLTVWQFATDGRLYSWLGIPVIGFGPGEERFAHTHQDHVRVADLLDAVKTYAWLACRICGIS